MIALSHHYRESRFKILMLLVAMALYIVSALFANSALAAIDVYEFETPQQEAQYRTLIEEFRCPKCQNQNLAGSDSQISKDLKRKTYELVMEGQSDAQIRDYMYERYGDFISYKPPVRPTTWILWFFPPLFLVAVLGWWLWRNSKNSQSTSVVSSMAAEDGSSIKSYNTNRVQNSEVQPTAVEESRLSEAESASLQALLEQHDSSKDTLNEVNKK